MWFLPVLATASTTSYIAYKYNQKSNIELAAQQQTISDLQQFRSSSASLDQALSGLSDAIVDRKDIDASRRDMRQAITKNLSDAVAAKHVLGHGTDRYIAGLADLRATVDDVASINSGRDLWQKSLNLMVQRRELIATAERRASLTSSRDGPQSTQ